MTKYCRAPNCSNSAGQPRPENRRLSFYKFPLHNPERLQQWLSQMNQEKWVPTKHQHLCSEHFAASCFEYRWGVRYLKPDAVPTIFQVPDGKADRSLKRANPNQPPLEAPAKKLLLECHGERSAPGPQPTPLQEPNALETLAIAIDPGVAAAAPFYVETSPSDLDFHALSTPLVGAVNLVPLVQIVEPVKAVTLTGEAEPGQPLPDPVEQQVVDFVASLPPPTLEARFGSSVEIPGQFCTEEDQGTLIIENVSIEPFLEADPSAAAVLSSLQESSTEVVAYFETIPTAPLTAGAPSGVTPPETVLSSALSLPIVSTVPIVSNQISSEASPTAEIAPELLSPTESLEEQLEEHRYHKNEACLQSSTIVPESGGAVAIICQNNDQALVYAMPQLAEEGNETIIHLEEQ